MPRILLTGGTGQLGIELRRRKWPPNIEIHAPSRSELDVANRRSIHAAIDSDPWACVINAAAYTGVDDAEMDPAGAFLVNSQGPGWLAEDTARTSIPLIHVSTDYVFSGNAGLPHVEDDPLDPINAYGTSKAQGEQSVLAANPRSIVLRTAWLLSPHRSNFLKTVLQLAAERPLLRVVADQRGSPTSASDLADAIIAVASRLIEDDQAPGGIYHFANSGEASRYELAVEILRQCEARGGSSAVVQPISSSEFPTAAQRPADSRLSAQKIGRDFGISARDWREAVAEIVAELDEAGELEKPRQ